MHGPQARELRASATNGGAAAGAREGRVLVLGSDTRSFLTVIRSLGRRGLAVEIAWCPESSPARRSRYVSAIHDLPAYRPDDLSWLDALTELLDSRRFDLVIPSDDPTALPFHAHRATLEPRAPLYLLSPRAFQTTSSKRLTHEVADMLSMPRPRQRFVTTPAELEEAAAELGFPLVLKPETSFSTDDVRNRRTHAKIRRAADLGDAVDGLPAVAEEHFSGDGVGVGVLASDGDILVAFQYRREHEPLLGGGSAYRSSMALDQRLLAACTKFAAELHYTGVAMFEFKLDFSTRRWALIEVNGRFWGALPLAVAAGVDFPYYLYRLLVEGETQFPTRYRTGVYCRNFSLDFSWTLANLRADRTDPILMTRPLGRVARDALRMLTLREHNDTLALDDPVPGVVELRQLASRVVAHRRDALALLLRQARRPTHRRRRETTPSNPANSASSTSQ